MAYHSYNTKGFILGSKNIKEANKIFLIYTKDLGLVNASAQGVRFIKSKLRYHLQDFSYCDISLIRGKEFWKITGAKTISNIHHNLREQSELFMIFARVFSLLKRLLHGEERNELLFEHLESAYKFALENRFPQELMRSYEYILAMRVLKELGYLGESEVFGEFVSSPYWSVDILEKFSPIKKSALDRIRNSLEATQL